MDLANKLLEQCDAYCGIRGISAQTLSGIIFKDSRTLSRIRSGTGSLTIRSYEHAIAWLRENWPDPALLGSSDSTSASNAARLTDSVHGGRPSRDVVPPIKGAA